MKAILENNSAPVTGAHAKEHRQHCSGFTSIVAPHHAAHLFALINSETNYESKIASFHNTTFATCCLRATTVPRWRRVATQYERQLDYESGLGLFQLTVQPK